MVQDLTTTQIYNIDASYRPVMEENNTKLMENDLIVYYKKQKQSCITNTMMFNLFHKNSPWSNKYLFHAINIVLA